jgi:hypothetical protein
MFFTSSEGNQWFKKATLVVQTVPYHELELAENQTTGGPSTPHPIKQHYFDFVCEKINGIIKICILL